MKFRTSYLSFLALFALACGATDPLTDSDGFDPFDSAGGEEDVSADSEALGIGTMHGGDYLFAGQQLVSGSCHYHLEMQGNGHLVAYDGPGTSTPYWTVQSPHYWSFAVMQPDGNFVVYTPHGTPYWSTKTDGYASNRFVVQNDGNLVVYSPNTDRWASKTVRGLKSWPCDQVERTEVTQLTRGAERPGFTYASRAVNSVSECGGRCGNDAQCLSWTFYPAGSKDQLRSICELKNAVPATKTSNIAGIVSGVKRSP